MLRWCTRTTGCRRRCRHAAAHFEAPCRANRPPPQTATHRPHARRTEQLVATGGCQHRRRLLLCCLAAQKLSNCSIQRTPTMRQSRFGLPGASPWNMGRLSWQGAPRLTLSETSHHLAFSSRQRARRNGRTRALAKPPALKHLSFVRRPWGGESSVACPPSRRVRTN